MGRLLVYAPAPFRALLLRGHGGSGQRNIGRGVWNGQLSSAIWHL